MYAEAPSLPVGTAAWLVPESCAWAAATGPTLSPSWPWGPCRARAGPESCLTSRQARSWGRFVGAVWIQGSLWRGALSTEQVTGGETPLCQALFL